MLSDFKNPFKNALGKPHQLCEAFAANFTASQFVCLGKQVSRKLFALANKSAGNCLLWQTS
jgi:hypothetical protein